jgi:hypothetical protein
MRLRILSLLCCGLVFLAGCGSLGLTPAAPADTPKPSSVTLINLLQGYLNTMDPVGAILDANFQVIDVTYEVNANNKEQVLNISINCEGFCSRERSFSVLMAAFIGVRNNLGGVLPTTLKEFKVFTFKHLEATGEVSAKWQVISDYLSGAITGPQLATRVARP